MIDANPDESNVKSVSVLAATALVVADMIGVGVYTSLGFQLAGLSSPAAIMVLWLIGGGVALCGAFCYAELAAMFPRSSGEYNLLARAFSPATGFLAGWLSATVGFAAPVALAALALGDYAKSYAPDCPPAALGAAVIVLVSAVHLAGVRQGARFQIASTALKIVVILVLIVAGLFAGWQHPAAKLAEAPPLSQIFSAPFAISLVFVMYSYTGWNAATYIVGEIHEPQKNLPKALFLGTGLVVALYVGLNAVFLITTPAAEMAGKVNVAQIAAAHIFGADGGRIVDALIALGLVSSISAMMWIGPRVTMTMGEDLPPMRVFARKNAHGAPVAATLLQMAAAGAMLFTQSFEAVLEYAQFGLTFCSFLTVLGLVKLRLARPDLERPYRAWGYPLTPLVFLGVTGSTMYYLMATRPLQSFAGLATMLAGLAVYGLFALRRRAASVPLAKLGVGLCLAALLAAGVAAKPAAAASADDTARFLAGMSVPTSSPLAPLAAEAAWKQHAARFDAAFGRVEARQLAPARAFAKDNLPSGRPNLIYMFSGPDFLYANALFPNRATYLLAGLEPVGAVPDLALLPKRSVAGALRGLEAALRDVLNLSFFRTIDMKSQFRATPVKGALPVLYVFLARSGKVVQEASLVRLSESGELSPESPGASGAQGAKIVFSSPGGPAQTLYFFSANVADDNFKKTGFAPFAAKLGPADALLKSASYLMHGGGFSQVRNFIMTRSSAILQDDTGVPARLFGPEWTLLPFGNYMKPIPLFAQMYQPKLAEIFRKTPHPRLPFGVGYRYRPNESGLLLATKKETRYAAPTGKAEASPAQAK